MFLAQVLLYGSGLQFQQKAIHHSQSASAPHFSIALAPSSLQHRQPVPHQSRPPPNYQADMHHASSRLAHMDSSLRASALVVVALHREVITLPWCCWKVASISLPRFELLFSRFSCLCSVSVAEARRSGKLSRVVHFRWRLLRHLFPVLIRKQYLMLMLEWLLVLLWLSP